MHLLIYRTLKALLSPLIFLVVAWRAFRGREDRENFPERRGIASQARPAGPLLWVHGASVGEVISTQPMLKEIRRRNPTLNLLLTTGTTTGRKMLHKTAAMLPGTGTTCVQYAPLDTMGATSAFIRHWQPQVSVFTESDFWPELLSKAPSPILLNGRISDRSWPRYSRWSWFFRPLISRFILVLAQRQTDADRLEALGAKNVIVSGNLKFDADALNVDQTQLDKFLQALQGRPVLVAASTHPGEEALVAQIHATLKPSVPGLLTIIVPRHPHRGTQAANEVARFTKSVKRRGLGEMPVLGGNRHTDIYIADSLGELGLWYRIATVALIGGSLVRHGGHNPLEPLKLGIPTLTGPHMFNFKDMLPILRESSLVHTASDMPTLTRTLQRLFTNQAELDKLRNNITTLMPRFSGPSATAAERILALVPTTY
ncbi:MAG: 3-deoxy-D-manno-octulosonic acid transferase [Alphaproteobacteria bacterium]|nr:MAG: 3-deoxy-D-manno-octulosonic acid transferase [Alphaproteobacteria bacterium]